MEGQTIFLGSDAGPGYGPAQMLELVPAVAHGEYFVDRYHCLRKVRDTMRDQPTLMNLAVKSIRHHDLGKLIPVLDTYQSLTANDLASAKFDRLVNYLARNWIYLSSPSQRKYDDCVHLGTIESTQRAFTYRMKKQGKRWSTSGAKAMIALLEARVNGRLDHDLTKTLRQLTALPDDLINFDSKISVHLRSFLKKAPTRQSCGAIHGSLYLDAATSSPIGRLAKLYTE